MTLRPSHGPSELESIELRLVAQRHLIHSLDARLRAGVVRRTELEAEIARLREANFSLREELRRLRELLLTAGAESRGPGRGQGLGR